MHWANLTLFSLQVAADALEAGTEAKLEGVKQKLHMATIQERITDFVLKHSAGPFLPSVVFLLCGGLYVG